MDMIPATPVAPAQDAPVTPAKPSAARWRKRIAACDRLRETMLADWQENVNHRKARPFSKVPEHDTVAVPVDWSRTKNKVAQLFYQVPEVKLRARRPEYAAAAPTFAAALNFELTHNLRLEHVMDEVLGDVINAAGVGVAMVGYEGTFETVDMPGPPDPLTGEPTSIPTPRPVYECYYSQRIDPAAFLWPVEFVGSDWQRADWLGYKGRIPLAEAVRRKWVAPDYEPNGDEAPESVSETSEDTEREPHGKFVNFSHIFYRPAAFSHEEKDHRKIHQVVVIENEDTVALDEPLPWQRYVPENRSWVGLTTFPIKVLTLTTISGEAIPPSDSQVGRAQVREMMKSRSQMLTQRDRSIPLRWYDVNLVDPIIGDKIQKGVYQDMIPMNGPGNNAIGEVARASFPRESFEFQNVIERDLDQAWSMGPNQQGQATPGDTSATEANIIQGSANVRTEYERARVLRFFLEIAEGVGALMQMFQDDQRFAEVIGQDGIKKLEPWDRQTIRGDYIFEAKPDAALRVDVGQKRVELLNLYKMVRRDPLINAQALITDLLQVHGLDPSAFIVPPKEEPPKPPVVRYSFNSADLTNPIVVAIAQKTGTPITPEDIAAARALQADAGIPILPPQQMPLPKPEVVLSDEALAEMEEQAQPPQHPGPPESVEPLNRRYERDGMQDAA